MNCTYHNGIGSMEYVTNMTNKMYQNTDDVSVIFKSIPKKPERNQDTHMIHRFVGALLSLISYRTILSWRETFMEKREKAESVLDG